MGDDNGRGIIIAVVIVPIIVLFVLVFMIGAGIGVSIERARAIEAKAAHWTVNATTGEAAFVYGKPGEVSR